jgi:ABC-2 type transport system ATP-binding protein
MTQRFSLYEDLTHPREPDFVARMYGMPIPRGRWIAALERLGLAARQRPAGRQLSGGWKQRLALAACMLHEPRCCCSTSRPPASIPRPGATSGTRSTRWRRRHDRAGLHPLHGRGRALPRLAYIAYGRLLARARRREVVAGRAAHLAVTGADRLARALAACPASSMVAPSARAACQRPRRRRLLAPPSRVPRRRPTGLEPKSSPAGGRLHRT